MAPASQSQTQSSEVEDTRFAELLKPIKDLTANWEVPLSQYLEEYLDDLQSIPITFDGNHTTVNFAQAALMLQGTASVYSKKVDFLWKLVLKMLEVLTSKKGLDADNEGEEGQGDGEGGKTKRKRVVDMTAEFEELEVDVAKHIDMKNDDGSLESRKNALNFIYITPRQLIEKEGSEQKQVKVNIFMGTKFDLLGSKEDFRINSQYVGNSGKLGDDLIVDEREANTSVSFFGDDSIDLMEASCHDVSMPVEEEMAPMEMACELPPDNIAVIADDCEAAPVDGFEDAPEAEGFGDLSTHSDMMESSPEKEQGRGLRDVLTEVDLNVTPEPVFDPWAPLDPHAVTQTPKAIKKGRTIKYPPSILEQHARAKEGDENRPVRKPQIVPIEQYLVAEMSANVTTFPRIHSEFYDLAFKEQQRRKEWERNRRKAHQKKNTKQREPHRVDRPPAEEVPDTGDDFWGEPPVHDQDEDVYDADCVEPEFNGDGEDRLPDPHLGGDIGAVVMDQEDNPLEDGDETTDSYEALVTKRVAEFVQRSQDYIQSSELTRRVSAWHETIGPRLENVERRKAFDVHYYGSHVLGSFPDSQRKSKIKFSKVVAGKPGEETARYFLSTLMLANTMNVQIGFVPDTDPELGMDNVMLTLLSTDRHHEQLEDFQSEASKTQEAASQSQAGPSSGRGTKAKAKGKKARLDTIGEQSEQTDEAYAELMEELSNAPVVEEEGTFLTPDPPTQKAKSKGKK